MGFYCTLNNPLRSNNIDLDLVILESATHLFVSVWLVLLLVDESMLLVHIVLYVESISFLIHPSLKSHSMSASPKSQLLLIYGYSSFISSLRFYQLCFMSTDEGCHNSFLSMGLFLLTMKKCLGSGSRNTLSTLELAFFSGRIPHCRQWIILISP